jgi:hypothetical protein
MLAKTHPVRLKRSISVRNSSDCIERVTLFWLTVLEAIARDVIFVVGAHGVILQLSSELGGLNRILIAARGATRAMVQVVQRHSDSSR